MAAKDKPLCPPEETMWQKYSAHFELPVAGMTSIFLHGLVVGFLAIGGIAFLFASSLEASKPPRMDVVMLEGDGTGFEGLGSPQGLPGRPDAGGGPKRTEQVTPLNPTERTEIRQPPRLLKDPPLDLGLPILQDAGAPSELSIELARIAKEADEQLKKEMHGEKAPAMPGVDSKKTGPAGTDKPKGQGGLGGPGGGQGVGGKQGPGTGKGGPAFGRPATKQEIYAWRWQLNLGKDDKEHAQILVAIGFVVAFPDPRGGYALITDLNRRPVEIKKENLVPFKDAVKWYSMRPESVQGLARELQMPFAPKHFVLLLPRDRETQMAAAERKYAQENNRRLENVRKTWFDFRLRNGTFEPVVIRQE